LIIFTSFYLNIKSNDVYLHHIKQSDPMTNQPKPRPGNMIITVIEAFQNRPSYKEVKKDLRSILSLDIDCDWSIFHAMIIAYLEAYNLKPKAKLTIDVTSDLLNAKHVSEAKLEEFLDTYCEVYRREEDAQ
jgi:hypothetical protein